jgi:hypothetical protein
VAGYSKEIHLYILRYARLPFNYAYLLSAVVAVFDVIARTIETGYTCAFLFLMTGTFNTVDHSILLSVLANRFDV